MKIKRPDGTEVEVPDDGTVQLKVDGEWKALTLTEAIALSSKASAADARFREAADKERDALARVKSAEDRSAHAMRLLELTRKQEPLTREEFDEVQRIGGASDVDDINSRWEIYQSELARLTGSGGGESDDEEGKESKSLVALRQELGEVKQALAEARNRAEAVFSDGVRRARVEIQQEIRHLVDKHPKLGKLTADQKSVLCEDVESLAARRLAETKGGYRPELLQQAVSDMEKRAQSLGLLADPAKQTEAHAESLAGLGLGEAAARVVADSVQTGRPIERVAATSPDYAERLTERLLARQASGEAESRTEE